MKLKDVKDIKIPEAFVSEYFDKADQYLFVQDWLENKFEDFPTLTDNPDFVDRAVEIIEFRMKHGLTE